MNTARNFWVPAVSSQGGFGRWSSVEVTDPWDAQRTILDGRWTVEVPKVKGCHSYGRTI